MGGFMNKNCIIFSGRKDYFSYRKYDKNGNSINVERKTGYGVEQLKKVKEEIESFIEEFGAENIDLIYQELGECTNKLRTFLDCSNYVYYSLSPSLSARYKGSAYDKNVPIRMKFPDLIKAYREYDLEEIPDQILEVNDLLKRIRNDYEEKMRELNELKNQFSKLIYPELCDRIKQRDEKYIRQLIPFEDFHYYVTEDICDNDKRKAMECLLNSIEDKDAKQLREGYVNYFPKITIHENLYDKKIVNKVYNEIKAICKLENEIREIGSTLSKRARLSPYYKEMVKAFEGNELSASLAIAQIGNRLI